MNKVGQIVGLVLGALALVVAAGGYVAVQSRATEGDIHAFQARVARIASAAPAPAFDPAGIAALPAPLQRYFGFTFRGPLPRYTLVRLRASGDFRRPRTVGFNPTTAEQVIAAGTPALMFSASTTMLPGVWARAYDFFADGQMEMKAKILSTVTVVDERQSPALNRISLRRWLLESALYPCALLPGGPVTWEAIDDHRARATVAWRDLRATMVAHFDGEGRMTHMSAESDGDLDTPYHGSGEHVTRTDYRLVGMQMIPHEFAVSRMAGGQVHPFWKGRIDAIAFE